MRRPARASVSAFELFSYAIAVLLVGSGVVVLEGSFLPGTVREARVVFGVVLLLLGIYRIVMALARRRELHRDALLEDLRAEIRADVKKATAPPDDPA